MGEKMIRRNPKILTLSLFLLSVTVACQTGGRAATEPLLNPTEVPTRMPTTALETTSNEEEMHEASNSDGLVGGVYTLDTPLCTRS